MGTIKQLLMKDKVFKMILFLFLLNITPAFDSLITFYYTDYLNFSIIDLANFSTFGTISYLFALIVYSLYFRKANPRNFFITTNMILWLISVSFLMVVFNTVEYLGWNVKFFCFIN